MTYYNSITTRAISLVLIFGSIVALFGFNSCGEVVDRIQIDEGEQLILHHPRRILTNEVGEEVFFISGDVLFKIDRISGDIEASLNLGELDIIAMRKQAYPELFKSGNQLVLVPDGLPNFRVSPYSQISLGEDNDLHLLGDITIPIRRQEGIIDLFYYPVHLVLNDDLELTSASGFDVAPDLDSSFVSSIFGGYFVNDQAYTSNSTPDRSKQSCINVHRKNAGSFEAESSSSWMEGRTVSMDQITNDRLLTGREQGVVAIYDLETGEPSLRVLPGSRILEVKWQGDHARVLHFNNNEEQVYLSLFDEELNTIKSMNIQVEASANQAFMAGCLTEDGSVELLTLGGDENYWLHRVDVPSAEPSSSVASLVPPISLNSDNLLCIR